MFEGIYFDSLDINQVVSKMLGRATSAAIPEGVGLLERYRLGVHWSLLDESKLFDDHFLQIDFGEGRLFVEMDRDNDRTQRHCNPLA